MKPSLLYLMVFITSLSAQSISFYREKIEMGVEQHSFEINGTYYFKNTGKNHYRHSIYYPFIIDESTSYPDSIFVFDIKTNKAVAYHKRTEGISIPLSVPPNDTTIYKIYYRQKLNANKAEYILTTTKNWGKPFELAEYTVSAPAPFNITYIYPPPDTIETYNNSNIYKSIKQNFMPDKNLKIIWR